MRKNQIWLTFLATMLLINLWYSGMTAFQVYRYYSYTAQTTPIAIEWSVNKKSEDKFILNAKYTFTENGSNYQGETVFPHVSSKREAGVRAVFSAYNKKKWTVWHSSKDPGHSTLIRLFPLKSCIYLAILWGIFLYFVSLSFYINKDFRHEPNYP